MAHPHLERRRQPGKQWRSSILDGHFGVPILPPGRRKHLAAQVVNDEVQPITDAQNRHAQLKKFGVSRRRIRIVNRRRPA